MLGITHKVSGRRLIASVASIFVLATTFILLPINVKTASALPAGFQDTAVFNGLTEPTVAKFASDGRVFVAEKNGRIKVFDNMSDTSATLVADLSTNVHNYWDRGLLGMALHPNFPQTPYIYVMYAYDAVIGGTAPRWGTPGVLSDNCPSPPGANDDGCVVSGRLSRLQISDNTMTGAEQVLINDWCQQYPSHSVGSLSFGSDGMLYASGGDGASFNYVDYGQDGAPVNPCGDPGGANPTPPTAEGGALRSQDVRTTGDPYGLSGTIIRVDPNTGAGVAGNPLFANANANAKRIVAAGMRNPFRITQRPGTNETFIGDVGWNTWEEVNRIANPADGMLRNFGWPCYEGGGRQSGYDNANLNICENLYSAGVGAVTPPLYAYSHDGNAVPGDGCGTGGSSISGVAIASNTSTTYPTAYQGALFFSDYSRNCIWAMLSTNGQPDPTKVQAFHAGALGPANLEIGPTGELFYAAIGDGQIRRIQYTTDPPVNCAIGQYKAEYFTGLTPGTTPVVSRCEANLNNDWGVASPAAGVPDNQFSARWTGTHNFSAGTYDFTTTSDDGIRVWIDNQLIIDNWTDHTPQVNTMTRSVTGGNHEVKVEYFENWGEAIAQLKWAPTSAPQNPTATITTPTAATTWQVGSNISFSGSATDPQQGTLQETALKWELILQHCPSGCHAHSVQSWNGVASGAFTAPDHEYPSYLDLKLTATDIEGNTNVTVRRLDPRTVNLTLQSNPAGRQLTVGSASGTAPFTRTVIVGSNNSISASSPQTASGITYTFANWSDGGAQTHNITAPAAAATYTANFTSSGGQTFTPHARINFQPSGAAIPSGYIADTGATYGARNGFTYGWNLAAVATYMKDRGVLADQRYDTFAHTQANGNYTWQMAVPNGTYRVKMVCGDPSYFDSTYRLDVEGVRACNAAPTTGARFVEATVTVTVTDGILNITNATGSVNNKLAFLDIDRQT